MCFQPRFKGIVITIFRVAPKHVGNGDGARKGHILQMIVGRNVFGPKIALPTKDMMPLFRGDFFGNDNKLIDVFQRQIATNCGRGSLSRSSL